MVDGILTAILFTTCANSAFLCVGGSLIMQELRRIRSGAAALVSAQDNREIALHVREKTTPDTPPDAFPLVEDPLEDAAATAPLVTGPPPDTEIIPDYTRSLDRSGELSPKVYSGLGKWIWGNDRDQLAPRGEGDVSQTGPDSAAK